MTERRADSGDAASLHPLRAPGATCASQVRRCGEPDVRAVGVLECGEPLVDVRRFDRVVVDERVADGAHRSAFVRVGVLDRLLRAADALPLGVRLVLVEGYRPADTDTEAVAAHSAGAGVDVTLVDSAGHELDMRTSVHASLLRCAFDDAGFVHHPTEWWHYSYGDRYWALMTGRAAALYDRIETSWL